MDGSSVGLAKAQRLASTRGVTLQATVAELATFVPVPGGVVVLEAFTPRQLAFTSGGPKQLGALYEPEALRLDLPGIAWEVLREEEIELDEGPLHRGKAAVVRGLGRRNE